ncbi:MAG: toll/interleukin-1 receptor domain-containing protein [Vicinamibacterales bacterium]
MRGVFISYRTDDTRAWAIAIRDHLTTAFGERSVFFDVDSIDAGQWRPQIDRALEASPVVLVLIGRRWLTSTAADGRARLFVPDDVHRREVAFALAQPGTTVIPVLVDGASLPNAADLPDDLKSLLACQVSEIGDPRDVRAASLATLASRVDARLGHRRERRHAAFVAIATAGLAIANTMVESESDLIAAIFLITSIGVGAGAVTVYRRMSQNGVRGAWLALIAVILSAAMVVGSLVRVAAAQPARASFHANPA